MKAATPWDYYAKAESPNGRFVAVFDNAGEICMGGPAIGTLSIFEKATGERVVAIDSANGAFVWAQESDAIAFPKWSSGRYQYLAVVALPEGSIDLSDDTFRVLELEEFSGERIRGVDSPIHMPQRIDIGFTRR